MLLTRLATIQRLPVKWRFQQRFDHEYELLNGELQVWQSKFCTVRIPVRRFCAA